jgi:catechol 2,3-dioxygenase-like lactoylglutathione lyase family enzyme
MFADARAEATVPTRSIEVARGFYESTLGLVPLESHTPGADVVYAAGGGTRVVLYEYRDLPRTQNPWTVAHFVVDDAVAAARTLRERGVELEHYGLAEGASDDGVVTIDGVHFTWFRDPDGNLLGLHD